MPTRAPLTQPAPRRNIPAGIRLVALLAALAAILVGLLCLFILPSLASGPHNLAVGIVASEAQTTAIESTLDTAQPGAFTLTQYDTAAELDRAITDRDVTGGIEITDNEVVAHVASAGSTAVSATITATATGIADSIGMSARTSDVVPLPSADPTGVGIGGLAFPLVFGGIVPAVAFRAVLSGKRGWILTGLLGFAAVGGVTVAAVLRFGFGSIEHSFWPVAGAIALGIAALALPLAALQECFGGTAFTAAAMLMMFVGNPFAGIATGSAWLPAGVGAIGQLLPPGATGTLVRSVAYFGGTGGATAAITLSIWALVGLALWCCAPAFQARKSRTTSAQAPLS